MTAQPAAPRTFLKRLGPGLITGAADDDPSGIATYSQAGAQFGLGMLWTVVLTYPLMTAVQAISARIGRVTGEGLAANLLRVLPRPVVLVLVCLLVFANTLNIGADLSAMGAAARLVTGASEHLFTVGFALLSIGLLVYVPYHRYVGLLKWMTMALLAYVAVIFTVRVDWMAVALGVAAPKLPFDRPALLMVVAIFGTTISPYLFFWESSEEVEDEASDGSGSLKDHPEQAHDQLSRIGVDNVVGMALSNLVAFFIILATAVTLHAQGVVDIQTSAQAAEALRPVAGELAFFLFSLGIVGTGLLAVPVLAGSAAYAVGDLFGWICGLERRPTEARAFYALIAASVAAALVVDYVGVDPIRALFWSAVVNGVISVPIMAAMLIVATRRAIMGAFVASRGQAFLGWAATAVMAAAVVGMMVS